MDFWKRLKRKKVNKRKKQRANKPKRKERRKLKKERVIIALLPSVGVLCS